MSIFYIAYKELHFFKLKDRHILGINFNGQIISVYLIVQNLS